MNHIDEYLERTRRELDDDGLDRFCTGFDGRYDVTQAVIDEYEAILNDATSERPLQEFLANHPELLVAELGAGCRWVIPQKRLGAEFVPDFAVARLDSTGVAWTMVELQRPNDDLLRRSDGRPTAQLNEGLDQIREWRSWLTHNLPYARSPRSSHGLGLKDIYPTCRGLVLIGRDTDRTPAVRTALQTLQFERQVSIHSYDWLAREAKSRISFRQSHPYEGCDTCFSNGKAV